MGTQIYPAFSVKLGHFDFACGHIYNLNIAEYSVGGIRLPPGFPEMFINLQRFQGNRTMNLLHANHNDEHQ